MSASRRRKPRPMAESRAVPDPTQPDGEPEAAPKESRSEQRAAAVRADLEPLAPGEVPAPLAISIAIAGLLGLGNLVAYAAGAKVGGRHPGPGILSFSAVMAIAVWGMVRRRYWAVLGFQALVALTVLYFCLLLIVASNALALIVCLLVIGGGSWLFWKLVRVMARIQTPTSTSP
jgi:hypothetical protein